MFSNDKSLIIISVKLSANDRLKVDELEEYSIFFLGSKEAYFYFKKNALKSNLLESNYLRSFITNYKSKNAPSNAILLPIINELKSVSKSLNEIARTANRFEFINARNCNRVIERIDFMSDEIREKLITARENIANLYIQHFKCIGVKKFL